jgi:predicted GH43/DUF377 family glycosyl hydrolase
MPFGTNDLMAFKLENNIPAYGVPVKLFPRFYKEQFEDSRCVMLGGRTFISCCNFIWHHNGWTGAHQIVCEVGYDWNQSRRIDPVYGYNGASIGENTGHEKNWLWFFREGVPHLVYKAHPHVVAVFDTDFKFVESHRTFWNCYWQYGEIRGGTPPVFVDNEYWTFFHSATDWKENKRQYHMGAYAFESKPPFRITKITRKPLLSGSQKDRWFPGKPICCFPTGSIFKNNKWLVVGGCNDVNCFHITIPHDDLAKRMVDV